MMQRIVTGVRRWLTQDVARTNAAQASVRLKHRRRQSDEAKAYLKARESHPVAGGRDTSKGP